MDENLRRVQSIVNKQVARQDQLATARAKWPGVIEKLLPYIQTLLRPLWDEHRVLASATPLGLLIHFDDRVVEANSGYKLEKGAQAQIALCSDGRVRGFRWAAHTPDQQPEVEQFAELGDSIELSEGEIGKAVVDFLEWGTIGNGRSRFATPV